jgi:carboxyl-terminal processing protease
MEDGAAIILSVAKYYSPEGKAIQDTGVTPGSPVVETDTQVEYDDNGEPITDPNDQGPQKKNVDEDPVVKKAIEVLK